MNKLIGKWGEDIVCCYLENRGYKILHCRWHCRYAEIDIIAQNIQSLILSFVEVKTRSLKNWDENGILAINRKKQEQLRLAGEIFLSKYPIFANWNCRFDVALLTYQKQNSSKLNPEIITFSPETNKIIHYQGYEFNIVEYLENAFD